MLKLSIIVPVYRVEKYLRRCLDSLLCQGFQENEYEIICVNDGSPDGSLAICEEYASKYSHIRVLSQANQGVSVARNTGLKAALGEAVCFVDSDDCIVKDGLSVAYGYFDESVDIVRYWSRFIVNGKGADGAIEGGEYFRGMGTEFILRFGLCSFSVCYLYRRSFLEEREIKFERIKMTEDLLFVSTVLFNNPRMVSTSHVLYYYYINPYSATTSRNRLHSRECVEAMISVAQKLIGLSLKEEKSELMYEKVKDALYGKLYSIVSRMLTAGYSIYEYKKVLCKLRALHLIPIPAFASRGVKYRIMNQMINMTCNSYSFYTVVAYVYEKLFLPYVFPHIDRNK